MPEELAAAEADAEPETERELEADVAPVADLVEVPDADPEGVSLAVGVALPPEEVVAEADPERTEADLVGVRLKELVAVPEGVLMEEAEAERDDNPDAERRAVVDPVAVAVCVAVLEEVKDPVLADADPVTKPETLEDLVAEAEALAKLLVGLAVAAVVGDADHEALRVDEPDCEGVPDGEADMVPEVVDPPVADAEGEPLSIEVPDAVVVLVAVD